MLNDLNSGAKSVASGADHFLGTGFILIFCDEVKNHRVDQNQNSCDDYIWSLSKSGKCENQMFDKTECKKAH